MQKREMDQTTKEQAVTAEGVSHDPTRFVAKVR
jgi:hypothetical protein